MQHIVVPVAEVMTLLAYPENARINEDSSHMMAVVDDNLHILIGDFTGIDSAENLEEVLKRNL